MKRAVFLIPTNTWAELGRKAKDLDLNRSAVLRRLVRWYVGQGDLPERPARLNDPEVTPITAMRKC